MSGYRNRGLVRRLSGALAYACLGAAVCLIVIFVLYLNSRENLELWHQVELDQEFTSTSDVDSFTEYLELEERLFRQLDEELYALTGPIDGDKVNRFKTGSLADPRRWQPNWNRTFRIQPDRADFSILLLHGLSDSPYSMRNLGQALGKRNADVIGLRIPGHGTAPSGLLEISWKDMAAAVRLAVKELAESNPNKPFYIVGYSNGAALTVQYALDSVADTDLRRPDGLVLMSPEIGVTPAAAYAIWQARLGRLLGLDKLQWNDIKPEYDPFKYGSFAVNAGDLSYRITSEIQAQLAELGDAGKLQQVPPILAFSSVVDATVVVPALVEGLFNRLPDGGHRLVLFDINVQPDIERMVRWDPHAVISAIKSSDHPAYELCVLTNDGSANDSVHEKCWDPGHENVSERDLGLRWPQGVHSLSHVALPFSPSDPMYGNDSTAESPGVKLGQLAFRGERGVLKISPNDMLRLRSNPFYSYLEEETLEFINSSNHR